MRCAALLLLLLLSLGAAQAEDFASEVRARLGSPELVRGQFEQKKQITALERPLLSSGDFLVARNRGVIWRTQKPFAQTLRLSRSEIVQEQDGQVRLRLSSEREPGVKAINQVLFALFAGDLGALEKSFSVSGKTEGPQWRAALHPTSSSLVQMFKEIRIEGASHVQRVEILEANGDRTEIRFKRMQTGGSLSAEEARGFD